MSETYFTIKYKGEVITGTAYVDGGFVEITDISIDALDLLAICDNNTMATIDQLIIEDYLGKQEDRAADYKLGYRD